jgi:hypothetical protein
MAKKAIELCAEIALFSEELKDAIDKLMNHQDDIQEDILKLQRSKRNGEAIDDDLLSQLKKARKESSKEIGLLSLERTELFDDLPVIRLATGKLKVIASELEKDAELIEQTARRIHKVTKSLQKAEKLILEIVALVDKL